MFFLGMLSIVQITILPGILILGMTGVKGSFLQRVAYTFALSLIFNYCLASILAAVGLYSRWSLFLIFIFEIWAAWRLFRDELSKSATAFLQHLDDSILAAVRSIFSQGETQGKPGLLFTLLVLGALGLAISSILWVFKIFIYNLGSVFDAWDTIISWNKWALAWAGGSIPLNSRLYPQLIPANWSVTYIFMGETTVQFFAKAVMPLFPLFILLAIFDLGIKRSAIGFFTAVTITRLLIKKFLVDEIANGYVDLAVAFFAFLVVHALLKASDIKDDQDQLQRHFLLGAIFAAGAAVTKQAGIYMLLLFPALAYIGILRPLKPGKKVWRKYLFAYLLISLIPAVWYIMKGIIIIAGRDFPEITELIQLSSATHGNAGLPDQIIASLARFEWYLLLFAVIAIGFFLMGPLYRVLILLLVIPYPLIWSWLAGYDTRNLSVFIPIFGLIAGMALQEIFAAVTRKLKQSPMANIKTYLLPVLLAVLLIIGNFLIPAEKLRGTQIELQKQVFSPAKNQQIYQLIEREGNDTRILTNYPVAYLPGLETNQVMFDFKDLEKFLALVSEPDIGYIFFPTTTLPQIKEYIDDKIEKGDYLLLFVDKEWVTYRMAWL
jgi:hypothetical protein